VESKEGRLGAFSMLGTFCLLWLIAWKSQLFGLVGSDLILLLAGKVSEIAVGQENFLTMFLVILATVVIELPCTIFAGLAQGAILGQSGKHSINELFRSMQEGNHFRTFFIMVLLEEILARWFFLGLLVKIPFISGTIAFYLLFLIGNSFWALVHLKNFQREEDRNILRVLPQFVAGIFFTYIFVKYGLLASVLAHFASNAVIFSMHKIQRFNAIDGLIIGYDGLCALVSYALMTKPLSDAMLWFVENPTFVLPGWGFWDYLKLSIFIPACLSVIFGALLYDRGNAGKNPEHEPGPLGYLIGIPLAIWLLYGVYYFLGIFVASVSYRVLVLAILFTFLQKGASGSAVSRTFWCGLPGMYIAVCILQAMSFWAAFGWMVLTAVIHLPTNTLIKLDD